MALKESFFASTSSETRATLGLVWRATSRPMWEAERPMSFTKCQYFRPEAESRSMLPTVLARISTAATGL